MKSLSSFFGHVILAIFAASCSFATAEDESPSTKAALIEFMRADQDLFFGLENIVSVTDAKDMLDKVMRIEGLLDRLPEKEAWRKKLLPLMKQDLEAIIKMSEVDQRKALDTIRSVHYAIQGYRNGNKTEAIKSVTDARKAYSTFFGNSSFFYLQCMDNELHGLLETQQADKAMLVVDDLIAQRLKTVGKDHPATATAYEFAARAEIDCGKWKSAGEHAATAIAIRERVLGTSPEQNQLVERVVIRYLISDPVAA